MLLPYGATLEVRCPGVVMPARVDPIILEKILSQFLASSLTGFDATGAIEIEVGWRSTGAELNQQVAISIACNTFGELDTSTQANEPDRVDVGAERESTSIALDISAATDMLSSCGGSLCVDYMPGRRHSLLVTLPRSGDDLEELPLRDASGFLPMGTETVIVVQREATTREAVCHILGAQGYTVLEAASNGEAVEMAWNLEPGETALVVAEFIDSIGRGASEGSELGRLRSNVRHLYTSAYVDAGTDAPLLTEADGDFVDSPFTPRSLVHKVREVLDREP